MVIFRTCTQILKYSLLSLITMHFVLISDHFSSSVYDYKLSNLSMATARHLKVCLWDLRDKWHYAINDQWFRWNLILLPMSSLRLKCERKIVFKLISFIYLCLKKILTTNICGKFITFLSEKIQKNSKLSFSMKDSEIIPEAVLANRNEQRAIGDLQPLDN